MRISRQIIVRMEAGFQRREIEIIMHNLSELEGERFHMMNRDEARRMAKDLVSQMTLEEKASQLRFDSPAIPRLGIPAYNWWNESLHGVARAGTATVFPQAIGLAAIFDEDFHEEVAKVISIVVGLEHDHVFDFSQRHLPSPHIRYSDNAASAYRHVPDNGQKAKIG